MNDKKNYIKENEIKVKTLMSGMYNSESALLSRIKKKRDKRDEINQEIRMLEKEYKTRKKLRESLTDRFEELKKSTADEWESLKQEYELILDAAEGDKSDFVRNAESIIASLESEISNLEDRIKKSSKSASEKTRETLDEMKLNREEMQKRLNEAKESAGDLWKEASLWFSDKTERISKYFKR